ncbi:MAG TPA: hypothetical protein ENG03_07955 [Thioploca sp.]|nr:MAG: hypothetical protein DRR19_02580 [Gammaproteobacteria bacterium]HDN27013.1 hypothetical protein [Thioploca sp.]
MAQPDAVEFSYFQEQLMLTQKMVALLRYSFERTTPIAPLFETENFSTQINMEQAEILEGLTARFARLADTLTQKLFRAIDALELTDEGSLIDRFNRMEKRDIVTDAQTLIEMRKLTNKIAHDYVLEDLIPLYQSVFHQCDMLFNVVDAIANYAREQGWA